MDRQQQVRGPLIGGTSLLVIFAVLCLTVFALLGFSKVQADKRLQDISAEAVARYYEADCRAEQILAELRSGNVPEEVQLHEDTYRYCCPISDTQTLQVEVRCRDAVWEILQWKAVSTVQWGEEPPLELWDGES